MSIDVFVVVDRVPLGFYHLVLQLFAAVFYRRQSCSGRVVRFVQVSEHVNVNVCSWEGAGGLLLEIPRASSDHRRQATSPAKRITATRPEVLACCLVST